MNILKIPSRDLTNIVLQLLFWFFQLAFVSAIASSFLHGWDLLLRVAFISSLNAVVFYTFLFQLIPKLAEKKKFKAFIQWAILVLIVVIVFRYNVELYFRNDLPDNIVKRPIYIQILLVLLPFLFTAGAAGLIRLILSRMDSEKQLSDLTLLQTQTELKFLRAQINPHFLFNTINNIYALAVEQSPQTPSVILQLSVLLRYMLYESSEYKVLISKEIQMVQTLISLYNLKYEESLNIKFFQNIDDTKQIRVVPLMFVNLVENSFKHSGIGDVNEAWINISLKEEASFLCFEIENTKLAVWTDAKPFGGIGTANLRRQLDLNYSTSYYLDIKENETLYKITLKIPIE